MPLDYRSLLCEIYDICSPNDAEEFIAARIDRVADAVATLDEREQCLISKRFPANGEKTTFAKASKEIVNLGHNRTPCEGLSTARTAEIFRTAINKLRGARNGIIEGNLTAQEFLNPPPKQKTKRWTRWHGINETLATMDIDELRLSARSANCLRNANISTVGELVRVEPMDLLKIKNFGRKCLNEIRMILEERGIVCR